MYFGKLSIKNFLSIQESSICLQETGLTLIEGRNVDDPSAKSNGAGKSSIVDSLCWCLYGKTARGVSTDDVVNRHAGKGCQVSVEIYDEDKSYQVVRGRKPNTLQLFDLDSGNELTKGTMNDTQIAIDKIMGCDHAIFMATIYAGQESMPDLPGMTDKQLKAIIENVIGVDKIGNIYSLASSDLLSISREIDMKNMEIEHIHSYVKMYEQDIETVNRQKEAEKEEIARKRKEYETAIAEMDQVLNQYGAYAFEKYQEAYQDALKEYKAKSEELDRKFANFKLYQEAIDVATKNMAEAKAKEEVCRFRMSEAKKKIQLKIKEIECITAKIGTKCPECGKIYTEADMEVAKNTAKDAARELISESNEIAKELNSATAYYNNLFENREKIVKTKPDMSDLERERSNLSDETYKLHNRFAEIKSVYDRRSNLVYTLDRMKSDTSNFDSILADKSQKLSESNAKFEDQKAKLAKIEAEYEVLKQVKEILGPQGVRQHILDTITPVLNSKTARYLNALSDGKLRATWTTISMTKKGEVKEKFNIEVTNSVGGNNFDCLSGGEKRKVRVACCLALQELVSSRATKPINLFIADEVDHALDEAGVERLIGVLEEKAASCGSLLVISHNPLRNWINNTITVVKENGESRIVG